MPAMTPPTYPDVLRLPNTCANGHRLKTPPIRQFAEARLAVQVRTTGFPSTMAFFPGPVDTAMRSMSLPRETWAGIAEARLLRRQAIFSTMLEAGFLK